MSVSRAMRHLGRRHHVRGQVLVLFAVLLPVLIGSAALLLDLVLMLRVDAQLRGAASAAARSGAQETLMGMVGWRNVFTLQPGTAPDDAARRVCDAYRRDGLPDLTCDVDVSLLPPPLVPRGDPSTQLAWLDFLKHDPTRNGLSGPGTTDHAAVTVTAHSTYRPFFLQALTHRRTMELQATQTAVLVTGP